MILDLRVVPTEYIADLYTDCFNRPAVQEYMHEHGETYDMYHLVSVIEFLVRQPEHAALCAGVWNPDKVRLDGCVLAVATPCLHRAAVVGSEISIVTRTTADPLTYRALLRRLLRWRDEHGLRAVQVCTGPYSPGRYSRILKRAGFVQTGELFIRS